MDNDHPSSLARTRVLFVNTAKAQCSIHESGSMMHRCLGFCPSIELSYVEVDADHRAIPGGYDCYAFNYHHMTMGWLDTARLKELPGFKLTFVLESLPNDPFVQCPSADFQAYCVVDPTMWVRDWRVYAFPRPLERPAQLPPFHDLDVPVIGTFGFPTPGKGFECVVDAVAQEFSQAIVRINLPAATYADFRSPTDPAVNYAQHLADQCRKRARPGITVQVAHDFLSKEELIRWCAENTLNCFLYDRDSPGLAATTDQAIASGRPLAISGNQTFRHIHPYIKPYPLLSLADAIRETIPAVAKMQADWSPEAFAHRFQQVLCENNVCSAANRLTPRAETILLHRRAEQAAAPASRFRQRARVVRRFVVDRCLPPGLVDVARRIRRRDAVTKPPAAAPAPQQFIHPCLGTFSQHEEDFILAELLGGSGPGVYVDVGSNDPRTNNNTFRLYREGWRGVNIEPGAAAYQRLCEMRPDDVNLNVGLASSAGRRVFYEVVGDGTLSSFHRDQATEMAQTHNLSVVEVEIDVLRLQDVFSKHVNGGTVNFLTIDAEGYESEILAGNEWRRFRPAVVMLEIDKDAHNLCRLMREQGYALVYNNRVNGIFLDRYARSHAVSRFLSPALA